MLFVPASVLAGLCSRSLLNGRIRFVGLYRTAIFVPFVVSPATTGILTNYLFDQQFGIVNHVLGIVGLPQQGWLDDQHQAMFVIAIMSLWGSAAFTTVIYLAALQDIPPELLEAASHRRGEPLAGVLEGGLAAARRRDGLRRDLAGGAGDPAVRPRLHDDARRPADATETIVYYLWNTAFHQFQFGYGSAVAYVLFGGTLVVTLGRRAGVAPQLE